MKHFETSKVVNVPPDVAYRVAADVPSYKDFLPLLQRSTVRGQREKLGEGEKYKAELVVAVDKLGLRESFVSEVVTDPARRTVSATSIEGPLHALNVKWHIEDAGSGKSKVSVILGYAFRNPMLQFAAGKVLELATPRIMKAFEERAETLARTASSSTI
jgi:coenzyme Q-binding protein COQ10